MTAQNELRAAVKRAWPVFDEATGVIEYHVGAHGVLAHARVGAGSGVRLYRDRGSGVVYSVPSGVPGPTRMAELVADPDARGRLVAV